VYQAVSYDEIAIRCMGTVPIVASLRPQLTLHPSPMQLISAFGYASSQLLDINLLL
jgi:hypothetical protein